MNKQEYYKYITIRNLRRRIRRAIRHASFIECARVRIIYKDEQGVNILKSRRVKNRIRNYGSKKL